MKYLLPRGPTARAGLCAARRAFATTSDTAGFKTTRHEKERYSGKKFDARSRANSVSQGHDPTSRLRLDSRKYSGRHAMFRSTVLSRFQLVLRDFNDLLASNMRIDEGELHRQASLFLDAVDQAFDLAEKNISRRDENPLFWNLRDAFIRRDLKGLAKELRYSFQSFLIRSRFSKSLEDSHKLLLDFRHPWEWFPATRMMQRTIHVHVGPTNSGKTYNALKALENAKSGVYAGPLRLLANEVYQRMQAKGKPCALVTGEEIRIPEDTDSYFISCTVEMAPTNSKFDVAVIDEIQMLGDPERGNGWTTALLGIQAKEIHVCGEERAVSLIQDLCDSVGDKCVIHRYNRLSPLETMKTSLEGDLSKLQKGDAVVAFSRLNLHALKRSIEKKTGRRCAIVYGSLPPEVRVQQAALFNDPDNDYDFIVASDAIGMGLNLEIRRVVMESVTKYDGSQNRYLSFPELKQIGGRAGRYRTARSAAADGADGAAAKGGGPEQEEERKVGLVTTMDAADLGTVRRAFKSNVDDIKTAYITPPPVVIERFSQQMPRNTPLSFMLLRIRELATVSRGYELSIKDSTLEVADAIEDIPLTIYDRLTVCNVPISFRAERALEVLRALARVISTHSRGDLLDIEEMPLEFLDLQPEYTHTYLWKLESLSIAINMYIWLSYRYSGMFRSQALAAHVRRLVEERLVDTLERMDATAEDLGRTRRVRRHVIEGQMRKETAILEEVGADGAVAQQTQEQETDDTPLGDVVAPAVQGRKKTTTMTTTEAGDKPRTRSQRRWKSRTQKRQADAYGKERSEAAEQKTEAPAHVGAEAAAPGESR